MTEPNENGIGPRESADPKPTNPPPPGDSVEVTTEPQNSTPGKDLTAVVYFQHVAGKAYGEYQPCERCGCILAIGHPFYTLGSPIYVGVHDHPSGCPLLIYSVPRPKSRFIVRCYDAAPRRLAMTVRPFRSWELPQVITINHFHA